MTQVSKKIVADYFDALPISIVGVIPKDYIEAALIDARRFLYPTRSRRRIIELAWRALNFGC